MQPARYHGVLNGACRIDPRPPFSVAYISYLKICCNFRSLTARTAPSSCPWTALRAMRCTFFQCSYFFFHDFHHLQVADSKDGAEQLSVDRALRAMRRAEVVVIVIDGTEGVTSQDCRLSEMAAAEGRAVVLVVNKYDKMDHKARSCILIYYPV